MGDRVNLEAVLITEIGQFGKYQKRLLAAAVLIAAVTGLTLTEYIFTTARIPTRCMIPECEIPGSDLEFSPWWKSNAIPTSGSGFDNCHRFANTTLPEAVDNTCPANLFNRDEVVACEDFVYENTHSAVYDLGLACDEWSRSMIGSVRTLGNLAGLSLVGFVSDHFGRRIALVVSAINTAWIGVVRYWAYNYAGFVVTHFFETFLGSGTFTCIYILLMELVGPKYRVIVGATSNSFSAVGQIIMGLVAWALPYWRDLTLALYVPQLLVFGYYWLVPESVRWYQSKGRHTEAEETLRKMARVNGKELSEKTLAGLQETDKEAAKNTEKATNEPLLIIQVFKHKKILIRCMVSPIWWITTTFVYYGLSINAVNMVGNMYLNFVLVAAVEIPGFWMAVLLMDRIGRRAVLTGAYWVCAACQVGYIFISDDWFVLSLIVYLIGKSAISMVGTTMYVYTAELYPTKYRHSLFAFSSMIGRIGSILAPLTPALGLATIYELPFILFASLALLSGFLVLITPETMGVKMPDTMEEANTIGRKEQNTQL